MPGPTASTSRPKADRGAFATRQRQLRVMINLASQGAILLILLAASAFASGTDRWLYLSACIVPVGFALVYLRAYRRGERERAEGRWSPTWEKAEARRGYGWLALVVVLWAAVALALRFS